MRILLVSKLYETKFNFGNFDRCLGKFCFIYIKFAKIKRSVARTTTTICSLKNKYKLQFKVYIDRNA